MSFVIKNDSVLDKYNGIWNKIKKALTLNFIARVFAKKNT